MVTENLARAFASTRNVLEGMKGVDLDAPTPCSSWKVRDLVNHIVGGAHFFGFGTDGGAPPQAQDYDWSAGDVLADFDEGARRAIAAFEAPGAQEKALTLPFGEYSGAAFMQLATSDAFTHGWDLAKATGQSTDLDPELAGQLLAAGGIPDQFRGPEPMPFGPVQEAPAGATPADKWAAYMGRTV
ncbi:MAG: TIGR03086 family metal-binding protein [Acidimicrobiales bacterium]